MARFLSRVRAFVAAESVKPFVWSETDCASTADRWVQNVCGFSPMERYGRRHGDEDQGRAWLAERGGLVRAMFHVMRAADLPLTNTPEPGDVGLIIDGPNLCVGIHAGPIWFSRSERGLIGASSFIRAWSIG